MSKTIQHHDAFGWKVAQVSMSKNGSYGLLVSRDMARSDIGSATLYVKGLVTGVNLSNRNHPVDRVPGLFTPTLADIPRGRYKFTAQEDSEWWCVDRKSNKDILPQVTSRYLSAGNSISGLILVCTGVDAGKSFNSYTAQSACYIITFDRSAS